MQQNYLNVNSNSFSWTVKRFTAVFFANFVNSIKMMGIIMPIIKMARVNKVICHN
ncbi:hypothetical protein [Mycoplasmopsis columbina]|uniref:Uncharacterized protein n=1 Tax=Mycoplasmopsis columbina SF7 TaxID=1037410 RepID=F9UK75_9BACT|nr:hypothetical protein [Mycoplasmopsis columbina]EGV00080.1 hypothetical protein MCSF7_01431 [Mycoplasmopsis columbina SF7]VEU76976.1 Uncharacterised protein [Mycoplasmopsis columbina]